MVLPADLTVLARTAPTAATKSPVRQPRSQNYRPSSRLRGHCNAPNSNNKQQLTQSLLQKGWVWKPQTHGKSTPQRTWRSSSHLARATESLSPRTRLSASVPQAPSSLPRQQVTSSFLTPSLQVKPSKLAIKSTQTFAASPSSLSRLAPSPWKRA